MIDWLSFELPLLHDTVNDGKLVKFTAEGEEDWSTEIRFPVRGSFDNRIMIRSDYETPEAREQGRAQWLRVDGNPAKFLQGHNIDGSEDLTKLAILTYEDICERLPQLYSDLTYKLIKNGEFHVSRVDINRMFDLGTDMNVEQWLHAAELRAHGRSGRASSSKGTVYLQKGSSLYSICFYNKHREITRGGKKHQLHENTFYDRDKLTEFAKGKLRCEVRILKKQLEKMELTLAKNLNEKITELYYEFIRRIDMNANVELTNSKEQQLPKKVLATYYRWKQGASVKDEMPNSTYHAHKKILKEFDIDITVPPVNVEQSNVVPLMRVLEAKPVKRPDWMDEYIVNF